MDAMIQLYMEETEDMLQKAEECLIRLEMEYSSVDINELFRIAHSIKGSSQMVGLNDIGNIMHKIEDMLDCIRNDSIIFDQNIVSLCFNGLDIVKKMLNHVKEYETKEMTMELIDEASKINETVEAMINSNKKKDKKITEQPAMGIVSSLLNRKIKGKNKFYITFFIEEDTPMVSPVILMILKNIEDIGTLLYSSITDSYFSGVSYEYELKTFEIILCTDIQEAELYTYFDIAYLERINIVDLTRSKLAENDYYFNANDNFFYITILKIFMKLYNILFNRSDGNLIEKDDIYNIESLYNEAVNVCDKFKSKNRINNFVNDLNDFFLFIFKIFKDQNEIDEELDSHIRTQLLRLTERAYNYTKGRHLFRDFKPENKNFIERLRNFTEMVNKSSTLIIFIDLSKLDILHEDEVRYLIEIKKQMENHDIELGIIAAGTNARRIVNIFDSIKSIEEFNIFRSEFDAIIWMFNTQEYFNRIIKKVNDV